MWLLEKSVEVHAGVCRLSCCFFTLDHDGHVVHTPSFKWMEPFRDFHGYVGLRCIIS